MESRTEGAPVSKGALWTSYIIEALILLLLTFDFSTKILQVRAFVEQAEKVGFSANTIFTAPNPDFGVQFTTVGSRSEPVAIS